MICFMPSDTRSRDGSYFSTTTLTLSPTLTASDLAKDYAFDRSFILESAFEFAPDFEFLRLGVRKHDRSVLGLGAFEIYVDLVAFLDRNFAFVVEELGERHLALALIVNVDD